MNLQKKKELLELLNKTEEVIRDAYENIDLLNGHLCDLDNDFKDERHGESLAIQNALESLHELFMMLPTYHTLDHNLEQIEDAKLVLHNELLKEDTEQHGTTAKLLEELTESE